MTTLAQCEADVAELLSAFRLFTPEGGVWSGAALFRWRELPTIEPCLSG